MEKGSTEKATILIIDDDQESARILSEVLRDDYVVAVTGDGAGGWELANATPPDLILLEAILPGISGFELCRRLVSSDRTKLIPVVFATKVSDVAGELQGFQSGCADYLAKPIHPEVLKARVKHHLALKSELEGCRVISGKSPAKGEVERLTREVKRYREALEEMSAELQSFCYSVSHDLRAPLRHLTGFSGALLEDYRDRFEGTGQLYLDCIAKAGKKMETLLDALLCLSRVGSQEMAVGTVNMSAAARDCIAVLQSAAPDRNVNVTIQEHLAATGDANLIRIAVQNLVDNAWKFTAKKENAEISFGKTDEGGEEIFFVRDNGAGFDMKYAGRLFGPFQRLHQEGEFEGAGVGLAIVQRIIRRHGGKIWADSKVGEGTTFYFTIPA